MHDKIALIQQESISTYRGLPFPLRKKGVLATAAALALLGAHLNAFAFALGAIQVQSVLGEPLRAEVEVPDISSEEAASFKAALGSPQEFQAAGVDYSQALRGTRITLNHRPGGQSYLSVQGQQPINEPFVSIVIDASTANGHAVRDYTLLIDPPPRPQAAASAAVPARQRTAPVVTSMPPRHPAESRAAPESAAASHPSAAAAGGGDLVRVQPGDTAAGIAETYSIEGVSLDQMLVAMLRANPRAFIHSNVNLMRAGAVINVPSAKQAAAVTPASARRMLIAQSRDFHAYREGLAATAARGRTISAGHHSATGSVQSQVQETNAAPPPPDRLRLSRGPSAGKAQGSSERAETNAAQSRQAQEQAAREAELRRNISELSGLASASGNTAPKATGSAANPSTPAINVPAPAAATTAATSPNTASTSTTAASAPDTGAPGSGPASVRRAAPPPPPEHSFMDTWLGHWQALAATVVIVLLLLAGYNFFRSKQKRENDADPAQLDSDLHSDGTLPHDSTFTSSDGQGADTRKAASTDHAGASMAYSPHQIEAVGDIDPVSEADVYLAYGRDAQAEEILKEALRTYPGRASIYAKLAEIYAKQHNTRQFEDNATEARRVTHGEGSDWQAILDLGSKLDPANPLYASGNPSATKKPTTATLQPKSPGANPASQPLGPSPRAPNSPDLNLAANAPAATPTPQTAQQKAPFGAFAPRTADNYTPAASAPKPAATESLPLVAQRDSTAPAAPSLLTGKLDFTPPTAPAQPQAQPSPGMTKINITGASTTPAARPAPLDSKQVQDDPLATKLALAQEFRAIGDNNSARALIKEVLADATGTLKTKAEQLLSELG